VNDTPLVPPDVWRIHGRDYDMTSFVKDHPGGPHMIMLGKGTDCTVLFETYHIINEPRKRLAKHDVTPDGQKPPVPDGPTVSPFMADVRTMIREHFKDKPKGAHKSSWLRSFLIFVAWCLEMSMMYLMLQYRSVGAGLAAGFFGYLVMVNLAHDASHAAYSRKPTVNTLMHLIGASPFVTGQMTWWMQHIVSHHQHTNEMGLDVDAHHFPFVRWHREVDYEMCGGRYCAGPHNMAWHFLTYIASSISMSVIHPIHFLWQPLCAIYCCGGTGAAWKGGLETATLPRHYVGCCPAPKFDSAYEKVAGNFAQSGVATYSAPILAANMFIMLLSFFCMFSPFLIWGPDDPSKPFSWLWAALLAFSPFLASSVSFMTITQVSHIQEGCQEEDVLACPDPFKRQAMTSLDYSASSDIVGFLTGSLNVQSIHHTTPVVSLVHYRELYPKFRAVCVQHNCAPREAKTVFHALSSHLLYVFRLGRGDEVFLAPAEPTSPLKKAVLREKAQEKAALNTAESASDAAKNLHVV